jgi:hypothetical protein
MHVLDDRVTPRVPLFQGMIYFRFAPLIALE